MKPSVQTIACSYDLVKWNHEKPRVPLISLHTSIFKQRRPHHLYTVWYKIRATACRPTHHRELYGRGFILKAAGQSAAQETPRPYEARRCINLFTKDYH